MTHGERIRPVMPVGEWGPVSSSAGPSRREYLRTVSAVAAALAVGGGADVFGALSARASDPVSAGAASDSALVPIQQFTANLFRQVSSTTGENLLCSPYSVFCVLAMARAGARGRTAEEMDTLLGVPLLPANRLRGGLRTLNQTVMSRAGTISRPGLPDAEISLDVANSLWGQAGTSWNRAFLDTLSLDYGTTMNTVDYIARTEEARRAINSWVSQRTHEKIAELLGPGVLTTATRLVLVNALYLRAPWNRPFLEGKTTAKPFTRANGSVVSVPMMQGATMRMPYVRGNSWQAVTIPYLGGELAMTVVLPDIGKMATLEKELGGSSLATMISSSSPQQVELYMPRWSFRTTLGLTEALKQLGMPTAFTSRADFTGISASVALMIDAVVHEAFIAVDEKGTEAAAATALTFSLTSILTPPPPPPLRIVCDRPFLFVLHDIPTATPLFIGRVADPTA
jgi:serine protease inhibitor